MENIVQMVIERSGAVRCLYSDAINLSALGVLRIERASHVEPDDAGAWWADLMPVAGPTLGPFRQRSMALQAEERWLEEHWLSNVYDADTF
jgi:hypothetical protein